MIYSIENTGFARDRRNMMYNNMIMVSLGDGSYIDRAELNAGDENCLVAIGKYTSIGREVKFIVGMNHDYKKISSYPFSTIKKIEAGEKYVNPGDGEWNKKSIIIGNDVWIGTGVTILGGVRIGNGAIIGAGTVVAKNIPAYAVVVGNPGKVIKYRFDKDEIELLSKLKWWNKGNEWIENNNELLEVGDVCCLSKYIEQYKILDEFELLKKDGYRVSYIIPDTATIKKDLNKYISYLENQKDFRKHVIILANKIPTINDGWIKELYDFMDNDSMVVTLYEYSKRKEIIRYIDEYVLFKNNMSIDMLDSFDEDVKVVFYNDIKGDDEDLVCEINQIESYINSAKQQISEFMKQGSYSNAMHSIAELGNLMYEYNQSYTDEMLEEVLTDLSGKIFKGNEQEKYTNEKRVLFYDGFGLDTRGLANIYLDALVTLGYEILYVTIKNAENKLPTVEKILSKGNNKIVYLPNTDALNCCRYISDIVNEFSPVCGFLYTTPYDVSGIVAFMHFEKMMVRYMINLTDHAFWLGVKAFDYLLEFRDYGANITTQYRGISKEKLIRVEFYPYINEQHIFAGFPFEKMINDFVIFSGGFLYKTFDKENTYYKMVEHILNTHTNVKFWYAGYGDNTELLKLINKYPGRVFHTDERNDLLEVMKNIDLYLGTYPIAGGLMVQYCVMAGSVPLSLVQDESGYGILKKQKELGIDFESVDKWKAAVDKFIGDDNYRRMLKNNVKGAVISRKEFVNKIAKIMTDPHSDKFKFTALSTESFRREYLIRFLNRIKGDYKH